MVLRVGQKARVDVTLEMGAISNEVIVAGEGLAQVETQSSQVGGTITGTEITQLELKGRDFAQLITLTPGVNNQSGQDEGTVGINGNVIYCVNGGRDENNNWELDGGDNMDNGSNNSLNVYPSVDSIQEVRVLTSNYGAQYGRNASGTMETETKSGTSSFHGDVYEFNRNNIFNDRNYFDQSRPMPRLQERTISATPSAAPFTFPATTTPTRPRPFSSGRRNGARRCVPNTFAIPVPSNAERGGDFSDVCPLGPTDCPVNNPNLPVQIVNNHIVGVNPATDPTFPQFSPRIPEANSTTGNCPSPTQSCYNTSSAHSHKLARRAGAH